MKITRKCVKTTPAFAPGPQFSSVFGKKATWHQRCFRTGKTGWAGVWDAETMKTLLRKVSTGRYFQGPGQWTTDPAEAKHFKSIDRALDFTSAWKLKDVELAFAFGSSIDVTGVAIEKVDLKYSEG